MKRNIEEIEKDGGIKTQKIAKINNEHNETFIKYSQNIDLSNSFNLNIEKGKVFNEYNERILYLLINKNSKINKKVDQILKFIKEIANNDNSNNNKEILFIANDGDSIQKMITIIEIIKQKIIQLEDYDKAKDKFLNDNKAKLEEYEKIVISGEVISNDKMKLNYTQLNYLDFTLIEKQISRKVKNNKRKKRKENNKVVINGKELYNKEIIERILKIDKLIKIPVMYVYMNLHGSKEIPVKYANKYKNLISNGWSIQQS